jgi:hypothetical protein
MELEALVIALALFFPPESGFSFSVILNFPWSEFLMSNLIRPQNKSSIWFPLAIQILIVYLGRVLPIQILIVKSDRLHILCSVHAQA